MPGKINLKAYSTATTKPAKVGNNRTTVRLGSKRINRLHGNPVMVVDYAAGLIALDTCGYLTTTTMDAIKGFLEAETGLVWRPSRAGSVFSLSGGTLSATISTTDSRLVVDMPAACA